MRIRQIEPSFVEYVPDALDDGILYVSIPFATATHKCFCGCGLGGYDSLCTKCLGVNI